MKVITAKATQQVLNSAMRTAAEKATEQCNDHTDLDWLATRPTIRPSRRAMEHIAMTFASLASV